jgi:predicted enzyme related to lactoylglutathione lyase
MQECDGIVEKTVIFCTLLDMPKPDLLFKKLDSIMYFVKDLDEAIEFFGQFGLKPETIDRQKKWCNLHMQGDSLCVDLSETIDSSLHGDPYYQVEDVEAFYAACREAGVKVLKEPFEVSCGQGMLIEGPSGIKLYILDLTKQQ